MATLGVNGAASGTLNERSIMCEGCRVNVPKADMLALSKCTVCGCPYEAVVTADGKGMEVATVAFTGKVTIEQQAKRKRWAVLESKRGRTYYHNTETGEDRWDKPADLEADAVDDAFGTQDWPFRYLRIRIDEGIAIVPFTNDAIKKAVLCEQMKLEATKMGVPTYVVAASQQQLQQEDEADDPFTRMVDRGGKSKSISQVNFDGSSSEKTELPKQLVGHGDGAGQQELQETAVDGGKCIACTSSWDCELLPISQVKVVMTPSLRLARKTPRQVVSGSAISALCTKLLSFALIYRKECARSLILYCLTRCDCKGYAKVPASSFNLISVWYS